MTTTETIAEQNKRIVETFQQEVLHKLHFEKARDWAHEDLTVHLPPGVVQPGLDNALEWFKVCGGSGGWFTNTSLDVDMTVANEDTVFQLITLHFVHTGEYMGIPPTGKAFSIRGLAAFKLRDGKITDHWGLYDMDSIPTQLGMEVPNRVV